MIGMGGKHSGYHLLIYGLLVNLCRTARTILDRIAEHLKFVRK